ncbi:protein MpCYP74N1 [Marchantia polymorpha subsp. ruderalis]|uniref:Allene oxide synthase n=2 Tax=Marchantia polymorpha TaxID=3197 RepID=A0AAF6B376_MARPO|nr:hypothetical protein MARPO_0160s0030 [Marchantia polymorpha]BAS32647.1 allene oxide synthase [Marchantia polymorpha]BBN06460.1 hypothetical protein Mp_3g21350 [Marchantia polymorpha subsp. ruderalis]|eukprot:PTQ28580.1 hypothetical protein MARPO_0160s0030 [Marchantia polymorpha]
MAESTPLLKASDLPLKEIPGSYGPVFWGAFKDKMDFYWREGTPKFYETRRDKYKSTVYRTNVAPGPPGFSNPQVVMLLDQKSYPILFDVSKVEKRDVFTGTYMPSTKYNGGYRILPYLDPSEEKHTKTKEFCFDVLKLSVPRILPSFHSAISECFNSWEAALAKSGKVNFATALTPATFKFNVKAFIGRDPTEAGTNSLGTSGPTYTQLWQFPQIAPILVVPVPKILIPLAEVVVHTFPIPFLFVKYFYGKLTKFFQTYATELLDLAESKHGLGREEATHNLLFYTLFNSWGGINIFFPGMLKRLGALSPEEQLEVANDVRKAISAEGGLTLKALSQMTLVTSLVYEALRIDPPVPFQYAHAKMDLVIESHDSSFSVKKGEMLAGYMPLACKDPVVFKEPDTFLPKRFMGDGSKLLKYVLWSNGPQTEEPSTSNKHCAGKDFILTMGPLFVAEIYSRYDYMQIDADGNLTILTKKRIPRRA